MDATTTGPAPESESVTVLRASGLPVTGGGALRSWTVPERVELLLILDVTEQVDAAIPAGYEARLRVRIEGVGKRVLNFQGLARVALDIPYQADAPGTPRGPYLLSGGIAALTIDAPRPGDGFVRATPPPADVPRPVLELEPSTDDPEVSLARGALELRCNRRLGTLNLGAGVELTGPALSAVEAVFEGISWLGCGLIAKRSSFRDGSDLYLTANHVGLGAIQFTDRRDPARHALPAITLNAPTDSATTVSADLDVESLEIRSLGDLTVQIGSVHRPTTGSLPAPSYSVIGGTLVMNGSSAIFTSLHVRELRIHRVVLRAEEADVGRLVATDSQISTAVPFTVSEVVDVSGSEILNLNPTSLDLSSLTALQAASTLTAHLRPYELWSIRIRQITGHEPPNRQPLRRRRQAVEFAGQFPASREVIWWGKLRQLLDKFGGSGRAKSLVRTAEFQWRRRELSPWRGAEWWGLSLFGLIGYGESIAAPLLLYVTAALVAALGVQAGASSDHWWSDGLRVFAKLLAQPVRFFSRDEDALKLVHDVPHGWWTTYAPISMQLLGAVLVFAALNAVRRVVRAT